MSLLRRSETVAYRPEEASLFPQFEQKLLPCLISLPHWVQNMVFLLLDAEHTVPHDRDAAQHRVQRQPAAERCRRRQQIHPNAAPAQAAHEAVGGSRQR